MVDWVWAIAGRERLFRGHSMSRRGNFESHSSCREKVCGVPSFDIDVCTDLYASPLRD